MPEFCEDKFNELWNINPAYDDPNHSYEKTKQLVENVMEMEAYSTTGELVTLDFMIPRYRRHVYVKNMLNEGVDPKYRKKKNEVVPLFMWVFRSMYNSIDKIPETSRHFYFWGSLTPESIANNFQQFLRLCERN